MKRTHVSSLRLFLSNTLGTRLRQLGFSFRLAKINVTRSEYRSTLLIIGIFLTIALETGIVVSVDTLYDDFIFNNRNQNYTDISVIPKKWTGLSSLRAIANDVNSVAGVTKASPVYHLPFDQIIMDEFPNTSILIYGIDPKTHPDFSKLNITKGEPLLSGNNVIVSQWLSFASGLRVGDSIDTRDFNVDLESRTFRISGLINDPSFFGNNIGYLFILINIETLFDIVPNAEKPNILRPKIDVSVADLLNIQKISEKIEDTLGIEFYVWAEKVISDIDASGIRAYQTAMNLVILASFVVEFLFITNILAITIRDRSKEIGVLRSVGTDSRQLIIAITIEILIYSLIGSSFGMIFGIGFAILLIWRMQYFYPTLKVKTLSLHPTSLFATFSSGIIVSLISGLYPIFIALSMPVVQNIHSRMRSGKSSINFVTYWKYNVLMGGLLALTGLILQLFVGPTRFLDFEILSIHFLVVLLIFLGTLLVEIGILIFLPRIAFKFLAPIFGVITRTISMRNIAREFQKSLLTIVTSALALTFIIVVGLVSAAAISAVPVYFQEQWGKIDLVAEARDGQLPDINLTNTLDGSIPILKSSFIQEERTEVQGVASYVYGVDPLRYAYFAEKTIQPMYNYTYSSFLFLYEKQGSYSTNKTYGLVSNLLFQKLLTPIGSNVTIKAADNRTVNVTIAAVIKSNVFLGNGEYLYISTQRFQEFFNSTLAKWFLCDVDGDVSSAQAMIEHNFPQFKEVTAIDFYAQAIERSLSFQSAIFQILFIESFILAAIAQFICILVSTLRMEREIGIMRALGLNKRGVFNIFMSESIALGLTGLFIGTLDGLFGAVLLAWYISLSIPVSVEFPLERIAMWVLFSFLVTIISTIVVSYRSSRKNVVNTISGRPIRRQYIEKPSHPHSYYLYQKKLDTILHIDNFHKKSLTIPEEMKMALSSPSTSLWKFIKDHNHQIQAIFLMLMVVITFNYLFDGYIIIRGLNPFDFFWRISLYVLPIRLYFGENYPDTFLLINPFLFILGLAIISPITYYFAYDSLPDNLILHLIKSFIWGIFGAFICLVTPFSLLALLITVIAPFSLMIISLSYSTSFFLFYFLLSLAIIGVEVILLQKMWSFLVFRGISPSLDFSQQIIWVRKIGSRGQIKFIGLILIHALIQISLFFLFQTPSKAITESTSFLFSEVSPFSHLALNPVIFLILSVFEISFFLLLIMYQIVQFHNQSHRFIPSPYEESRKSILTLKNSRVDSPQKSENKLN